MPWLPQPVRKILLDHDLRWRQGLPPVSAFLGHLVPFLSADEQALTLTALPEAVCYIGGYALWLDDDPVRLAWTVLAADCGDTPSSTLTHLSNRMAKSDAQRLADGLVEHNRTAVLAALSVRNRDGALPRQGVEL